MKACTPHTALEMFQGARGPSLKPCSSATGQQADPGWSCDDKLAAGKRAPRAGENIRQVSSWKARFFYKADRSTRLPMLLDQQSRLKKTSEALAPTNLPGAISISSLPSLSIIPSHQFSSQQTSPCDCHEPCLPRVPAARRFLPSLRLIYVSLSQVENYLSDTECFPYGTRLIKY